MIIAVVCVAVILVIVGIIFISRKNNKKTVKKLDESISKLKKEQEDWSQKEVEFEKDKKEKDAFSHIQLSDDIEEELGMKEDDIEPAPSTSEVPKDFSVNNFGGDSRRVNSPFYGARPFPQAKKKSREDDFEEFMNEHSYSRKIFDSTILNSIKDLPPKLKAIIIGNIFDKYDI